MQNTVVTNAHLYGLDKTKLIVCDTLGANEQKLHIDAAAAFKEMQIAAVQAGVSLHIASGFRSFAHQQRIWEYKFHHESRQALSNEERIADILRWSALPGTSRHHWGSDFDAYDSATIERSALTLEPWEYEQGGPCHKLFLWLEKNAPRFGFYRPYDQDRGGVAPEPWHWSYAPLASIYLSEFNSHHLRAVLAQAQLSGLTAESDLDNYLHAYVQTYVMNVATANI